MSTTNAVRTQGLTRRFKDRTVVDGVDLEVQAGEIYGFLGPNGAGKTTTMRMILGLTSATAGTATVLGHPAGDPRTLARTGLLIEEPALYPYLSGRDNLRAIGRYSACTSAQLDRVLDTVGLEDDANRRVSAYSLGMRQRLGVAMALLKDPDLLVLDEPTNGLDPAGVLHMRELLSPFAADGRTVLLSSHALGEVDQICDRVGILAEGKLVAQGSVADLRGDGVVIVTATPLQPAIHVLGVEFGSDVIVADGTEITVKVHRNLTARVNHVLVQAGLEVTGLAWREPSLSDVFFGLTTPTGGDK